MSMTAKKLLEILKQDPTVEETSNPEEADIILLNTCSIREKAEEKVYSELGRLRKLKIENPNLKIGVGGCVASQEGKNIFKRAPYVDLIFGPQTIHKVPSLLSKKNKIEAVDVSFPIEEKFDCSACSRGNWNFKLCFHYGRMFKILLFLCCAIHSR